MIYSFFRFLFRISIRLFFRAYTVRGKEHVPSSGPVIFVANHPSTFMDPIVVGVALKRKVFFIAKAEVFKGKLLQWLLPKFNMIPVYRAQDDPTQMHKNKETFKKCFDHLAKGGCLLIFPEGISLTERKLKKIKTGAARIALGAEAEHDFKLGVKIISVGLNYSNPHKFQSNLFVNIDAPIHVAEYRDAYEKDAFETSTALTEEIRSRLEKQVVAIEDAELDGLVKDIEVIYKSKLMMERGFVFQKQDQDFLVTRDISERVHYFAEKEPGRLEAFRHEVNEYKEQLMQVGITDLSVRSLEKGGSLFLRSLGALFYFIIGLPVFIFGTINNYIPYRLPYNIAKKLSSEPQYRGALMMVAGTFLFAISWLLQLWAVHHFTHSWPISFAYLFLLPLSGLFAFYYWRYFTNVRGRWKVLTLFLRESGLVASLIAQRKKIVDELEQGRKEFNENVE